MSSFHKPRLSRPPDRRVRCIGHPTAPIGMGEHVRSVFQALAEAGIDAAVVDIYGPGPAADPAVLARFAPVTVPEAGEGVNIYCINGDEVAQALAVLRNRRAMAPGSVNVIYPAWELERYPAAWVPFLECFDEVWAPSAFIRDAIAAAVSIPVVHMPLACEVTARALRGRRHFGIRESAYTFFFSFDFKSYLERKNPFAVVEAFRLLTERRPFADVELIIKTNNSDARPEMKARFDAAVAPFADRVTLIDGTLSDLEMKALAALSDAFVSLHRSEGFGRGLSEAMALGKPVIATAYSGNMDFCNEETALLVPYDLVSVREGDYPHFEGQHWADPDVEVAANWMEQLIDHPGDGQALGRRARRALRLGFAYLPIGLRYAERLRTIQCVATA